MINVVIVTNMPTPYRTPVFNKVNNNKHINLSVIYCTELEDNRDWNIPKGKFNEIFLKKSYFKKSDGFNYIHCNFDVLSKLKELNPDIVISCGFNPTHIITFLYCKMWKIKHYSMTDGWRFSESKLTLLHRWIRLFVYKYSVGIITPSVKGIEYFKSDFNINEKKIHKVPLVSQYSVDEFSLLSFNDREFDFIFVGNFEERKNPILFLKSCIDTQEISKVRLKIAMIGKGSLLFECEKLARELNLDVEFSGAIQPKDVMTYLSNSKFFVFPSNLDAWGLVVNEAMTVGTPVISSIYAASTFDLIVNNENGFVLESLDRSGLSKLMVKAYSLSDSDWVKMSNKSLDIISKYSISNSSQCFIDVFG